MSRRSVLALLLALLTSACSGQLIAAPSGDGPLAVATPEAAPAPTPSEHLDREAIGSTLEAAAAAFLDRDADAMRAQLDDPTSAFGSRWVQRLDHVRDVPFASYRLILDPSLPDLATDAVRDRYDAPAVVVYVVEEHALEGYDEEGPASEDLFLTLVLRDGRWRLAGDQDAETLGLVSADHLWDHGPVRVAEAGGFLALHHPETADQVPTLLAEAQAGLDQVRGHWSLDWDERVPLIVPRDQDELAELLHVTFDLSNFIAFATATPRVQLGTYELTGSRMLLNTPRFLERTSETRRRIFAHELLHVATRPVTGPLVPAWVEEGLAQRLGEQASTTGTSLLSALVARGFDGRPPTDAEFTTGGRDRIFLSYQLAWSFVDHLADRYGEGAVAEFYRSLGERGIGQPGRESHHLDRASREVFGLTFEELRLGWTRALGA